MARAALVTGAARGIGRAMAERLAAGGFDLALHYRSSQQQARRLAAELRRRGRRAVLVRGDLTEAPAAAAVVVKAARLLGGLSVVVNNVGDYLYKPVDELAAEEWRRIIDSNLNSAFYVTQAALPHLRAAGRGRIIFIGYAGAGKAEAKPHITPYFIAKSGLVLYAKALAERLAAEGVTVNVVAPGVAENSLTKPLAEIPMGRPAYMRELAAAVMYFISEEADYVTGQVIEVAGGWNL